MMLWLYTIFLLIAGCVAQDENWNGCPPVKLQKHLDYEKFAGFWYQSERTLRGPNMHMKCLTINQTWNEDKTYSMVEIGIYLDGNKNDLVLGHTEPLLENKADFDIHITHPHKIIAPAWILKANYSSYAVMWGCIEELKMAYIVILTRDQNPSKSVMNKARQVLRRNNLNGYELHIIDNNNCPEGLYWKENLNVLFDL